MENEMELRIKTPEEIRDTEIRRNADRLAEIISVRISVKTS